MSIGPVSPLSFGVTHVNRAAVTHERSCSSAHRERPDRDGERPDRHREPEGFRQPATTVRAIRIARLAKASLNKPAAAREAVVTRLWKRRGRDVRADGAKLVQRAVGERPGDRLAAWIAARRVMRWPRGWLRTNEGHDVLELSARVRDVEDG